MTVALVNEEHRQQRNQRNRQQSKRNDEGFVARVPIGRRLKEFSGIRRQRVHFETMFQSHGDIHQGDMVGNQRHHVNGIALLKHSLYLEAGRIGKLHGRHSIAAHGAHMQRELRSGEAGHGSGLPGNLERQERAQPQRGSARRFQGIKHNQRALRQPGHSLQQLIHTPPLLREKSDFAISIGRCRPDQLFQLFIMGCIVGDEEYLPRLGLQGQSQPHRLQRHPPSLYKAHIGMMRLYPCAPVTVCTKEQRQLRREPLGDLGQNMAGGLQNGHYQVILAGLKHRFELRRESLKLTDRSVSANRDIKPAEQNIGLFRKKPEEPLLKSRLPGVKLPIKRPALLGDDQHPVR